MHILLIEIKTIKINFVAPESIAAPISFLCIYYWNVWFEHYNYNINLKYRLIRACYKSNNSYFKQAVIQDSI